MQTGKSSFVPRLEEEGSTWNYDSSRGVSQLIGPVGIRVKASRLGSLRNRGVKIATLAIAAFFLVAVVYTAFCRRTRRTLSGAGSRHRRLAEGGEDEGVYDEELQAILEGCVDYEEERGILPSIVLSADTTLSSPAEKKAKLVALAHETVSSFLASLPTHEKNLSSSFATGADIMPSLAYVDLPLASSEPLQPLSAEFVDLHLPSLQGDTLEHALFEDSGISPPEAALEADAWLNQIPFLIKPEEDDLVIVEESKAEGSPETDVQPSTLASASADLLPASPALKRASHHRYVRLPKVQPGAIKRALMLQAARSGPRFLSRSSSFDMLATMRALFVKFELDAADVEELCQAVEKMISYVHKRISPDVGLRRFGELVSRFGRYFLILDSVVRACEILGPAALAEYWWNAWRKDDEIYRAQVSSDESEDQEDYQE
ncbi:hypothetical protein Emag_007268 [Eimeria magna]